MKELIKNTEEKMNKTVAVLERDYKSIRAGRANAAVLDRIAVDYYGVPTPIQQMAAVSVPEPRVLMIQPWDATTLKTIEKAILTSDIGINPQNDGKIIRLQRFNDALNIGRRELRHHIRAQDAGQRFGHHDAVCAHIPESLSIGNQILRGFFQHRMYQLRFIIANIHDFRNIH